jgi:hypothetical protein
MVCVDYPPSREPLLVRFLVLPLFVLNRYGMIVILTAYLMGSIAQICEVRQTSRKMYSRNARIPAG